MYPSQVRNRILEDHNEIRALLEKLEELEAAPAGEAASVELINAATTLKTKLRAHIELEDEILDPALNEVGDAWRKLRQQKLQDLHVEHERLLATLDEVLKSDPVASKPLHDTVNALIASVREDMELEESILLSDNVLRDDAVAIAQSDG